MKIPMGSDDESDDGIMPDDYGKKIMILKT